MNTETKQATARPTPGPWVAVRNEMGAILICPSSWGEAVEREAIAKTLSPTYHPGGLNAADAEVSANGRLIAAAPDLFKALGAFVAFHGSYKDEGRARDGAYQFNLDTVCDMARAALALARGDA